MKTYTTEKEWVRSQIRNAKNMDKNGTTNSSKVATKSTGSQGIQKKGANGFNDVAGMEDLKKLVREGFINVLNNRDCAKAYGILPPSLLFYGPAGCGKTFFAEKIAEEVGINFMKVAPDDIASTLIHGTQEKICELFRKAERKAPTLIFFDEFDAMVPRRTNSDRQYQNGEVNEFLCMLNNASEKGVYVIAATNHPENIDKAVLRTGRIDEMIYIDMPDDAARNSLFRLALSKLPTANDINYERLADMTKGYNCSDISYIIKLASRNMFNMTIAEKSETCKLITQSVLEEAISQKSPSVSSSDLREYERIRGEFSPKDQTCRHKSIGFC